MSAPNFLPTPSPASLDTFRALYLARFGVHLSEEQTRDLATRYLLIYSLGTLPAAKPVDKGEPLPKMEAPNP